MRNKALNTFAARLSYLSVGVTTALLFASAWPAHAQGTSTDPRWQAWIGCWQSMEAPGHRVIGSPGTSLVCVTPAAGTSAVEVATVVSGKIVERTAIEANGQRHARTKDGCTGWESATWSRSMTRVYLRSDYTCSGGLKRSSNGLLALSPKGEWLDVQNVTTGKNTGLRVVRLTEVSDLSPVPAEITSALQGHTLQTNAWRTAAAAQLAIVDVAEASGNLDAAVVEAWLVERDQGFNIDAKTLTMLADADVPASVIDVMVALAYPKVFALNPATRAGEFRPAEQGTMAGTRGRGLSVIGFDPMGYPMFGYGSFYNNQCTSSNYGYYSPYSAFSSGCSYGYNGFGYNGYGTGYGYGNGYGYGYGGGYGYGSYPVVVVVKAPEGVPPGDRPRVVNGSGYTQGSSGTSGSSSTSSGSGSSGSGSSGGTSSGGSSAPAPRTAHPRP